MGPIPDALDSTASAQLAPPRKAPVTCTELLSRKKNSDALGGSYAERYRQTVLDDVGQLVELTRVGDEGRFFFDLSWRYLSNASCQDGTDKRKPRSFIFDRTE